MYPPEISQEVFKSKKCYRATLIGCCRGGWVQHLNPPPCVSKICCFVENRTYVRVQQLMYPPKISQEVDTSFFFFFFFFFQETDFYEIAVKTVRNDLTTASVSARARESVIHPAWGGQR
jgi:hypothetical protein